MTRFRFRDWRFWFVAHEGNLGLLFLLVGSIPVIGILVWLFSEALLPAGEITTVEGELVGMGFHETDQGSIPTGSVRIDDTTVRIALPARLGCQVGDHIQLRRRELRFGYAYGVGANPRPCSKS